MFLPLRYAFLVGAWLIEMRCVGGGRAAVGTFPLTFISRDRLLCQIPFPRLIAFIPDIVLVAKNQQLQIKMHWMDDCCLNYPANDSPSGISVQQLPCQCQGALAMPLLTSHNRIVIYQTLFPNLSYELFVKLQACGAFPIPSWAQKQEHIPNRITNEKQTIRFNLLETKLGDIKRQNN